jgi:hypothetical protein
MGAVPLQRAFAFNLVGTSSLPPAETPGQTHSACVSLQTPSATATANPCGAGFDGKVASSISAAVTSAACVVPRNDTAMSCPKKSGGNIRDGFIIGGTTWSTATLISFLYILIIRFA